MIIRSGVRSLAALVLLASPLAATAGDHILTAETIVETKAVYGQVQARNSVLARARIGSRRRARSGSPARRGVLARAVARGAPNAPAAGAWCPRTAAAA